MVQSVPRPRRGGCAARPRSASGLRTKPGVAPSTCRLGRTTGGPAPGRPVWRGRPTARNSQVPSGLPIGGPAFRDSFSCSIASSIRPARMRCRRACRGSRPVCPVRSVPSRTARSARVTARARLGTVPGIIAHSPASGPASSGSSVPPKRSSRRCCAELPVAGRVAQAQAGPRVGTPTRNSRRTPARWPTEGRVRLPELPGIQVQPAEDPVVVGDPGRFSGLVASPASCRSTTF